MIQTPVSIGELVDKLTILAIKLSRIKNADKIENIKKEHDLLENLYKTINPNGVLDNQYKTLLVINNKLWDIEDEIRNCELEKDFGSEFIQLARAVYHTNDERSRVKKEINVLTGSGIIEEKSYCHYK